MIRQERRTGVRWEVPGGGQEAGETLEAAAVREAREEAGVDVSVDRLICTYASYRLHTGTVVLGAFYRGTLVDTDVEPVPQLDEGIVEVRWLDPRSLGEGELGPLTQRVLDRWWPARDQAAAPFHVELWRDRNGYLPG
ncbi:NUDIX hydrolase [Cryptosporangium japonicum]|uniref:Nudix hydrolase domain-containing protein n=1 Tax=Cryptosporangium japonicum TaxID=80872 RepID=A0ABP3EPA2_9ACTN